MRHRSKTGGFAATAIPTFVNRTIRRGSLDSFSDNQSENHSAEVAGDKALYSPSGRSVGSSTFIGSPVSEKGQETIPCPVVPPIPPVHLVPQLRIPEPRAVRRPMYTSSTMEGQHAGQGGDGPLPIQSDSVGMV